MWIGRVAAYAGHPKWDYGVGFVAPDGATRCAVWIEVHNATPGDVRSMVAKLQTSGSTDKVIGPVL